MANPVENLYSGNVSFTTSTVITLPASVDQNRALVLLSVNLGSDYGGQPSHEWISSTQLRLNIRDANTSTVEWRVIEFTLASGIAVQHGYIAPAGGEPYNISISSVNLNESFVMCYAYARGQIRRLGYQCELTSTTNLSITKINGNDLTSAVSWQVISIPGASVQSVSFPDASGTRSSAITAVDLTKTIIVGSFASDSSKAGAVAYPTVDLESNTSVRLRAPFSVSCLAYVVESDFFNVQTIDVNVPTDDTTATISAVDLTKSGIIANGLFHHAGRSTSGQGEPAFGTLKLESSTSVRIQTSLSADSDHLLQILEFVDPPVIDPTFTISGASTASFDAEGVPGLYDMQGTSTASFDNATPVNAEGTLGLLGRAEALFVDATNLGGEYNPELDQRTLLYLDARYSSDIDTSGGDLLWHDRSPKGRDVYASGKSAWYANSKVTTDDTASLVPVLAGATILAAPDGANPPTVGEGIVNTGLEYAPFLDGGNGGLICGNQGDRIYPSICELDRDGNLLREIEVWNQEPVASSVGAVQGVTYDSKNDSYWFAHKGDNKIYEVDRSTGILTGNSIDPGSQPNGLAYHPSADGGNGGFWYYATGGANTLRLLSRSGVDLITSIVISADQLSYDDDKKLLYATSDPSYINVYDVESGSIVPAGRLITSIGPTEVEGIAFAPDGTVWWNSDEGYKNQGVNYNAIYKYEGVLPKASKAEKIYCFFKGTALNINNPPDVLIETGSDASNSAGTSFVTTSGNEWRMFSNTTPGSADRNRLTPPGSNYTQDGVHRLVQDLTGSNAVGTAHFNGSLDGSYSEAKLVPYALTAPWNLAGAFNENRTADLEITALLVVEIPVGGTDLTSAEIDYIENVILGEPSFSSIGNSTVNIDSVVNVEATHNISGTSSATFESDDVSVFNSASVTSGSFELITEEQAQFSINCSASLSTSSFIFVESLFNITDGTSTVSGESLSEAVSTFGISGSSASSFDSFALQGFDFDINGTTSVTIQSFVEAESTSSISGTSNFTAASEDVSAFSISGSSSISAITLINVDTQFSITGTSSMAAELQEEGLVNIAGSSVITANSFVNTQSEFNINGSSSLSGLSEDVSVVSISGSSSVSSLSFVDMQTDINISASSSVNAQSLIEVNSQYNISGSSSVYFPQQDVSTFSVSGNANLNTSSFINVEAGFDIDGSSIVSASSFIGLHANYDINATSVLTTDSFTLAESNFDINGSSDLTLESESSSLFNVNGSSSLSTLSLVNSVSEVYINGAASSSIVLQGVDLYSISGSSSTIFTSSILTLNNTINTTLYCNKETVVNLRLA